MNHAAKSKTEKARYLVSLTLDTRYSIALREASPNLEATGGG